MFRTVTWKGASFIMLAGLAVSLSIVQCAKKVDHVMTDTEIHQKMVGIWIIDSTWPGPVPAKVDGTMNLAVDGKFFGVAIFAIANDKRPVVCEGNWQVKEGVLIETVTKSSSKIIRVGAISRDKIIRVNKHELIFQTEQGGVVTRKRKDSWWW